jgi:hypothetical protein
LRAEQRGDKKKVEELKRQAAELKQAADAQSTGGVASIRQPGQSQGDRAELTSQLEQARTEVKGLEGELQSSRTQLTNALNKLRSYENAPGPGTAVGGPGTLASGANRGGSSADSDNASGLKTAPQPKAAGSDLDEPQGYAGCVVLWNHSVKGFYGVIFNSVDEFVVLAKFKCQLSRKKYTGPDQAIELNEAIANQRIKTVIRGPKRPTDQEIQDAEGECRQTVGP